MKIEVVEPQREGGGGVADRPPPQAGNQQVLVQNRLLPVLIPRAAVGDVDFLRLSYVSAA